VPSGSGISYNASTGVLQISGNASLTLPNPPTVYYFSQVSISGNGNLVIASGGSPMTIYVDNQLSISGNGVANNAQLPSALSFSACGSPSSPAAWTLSGNADSYYTIYAPNHDITQSGNAAIYGAIIGKSFTNSGNGALHYDKSLQNARAKTLAPVVGSWSQVSAF
jgi:hypothetical protein